VSTTSSDLLFDPAGAQLHAAVTGFICATLSAKILELNRWLKNYCVSSPNGGPASCIYVDYFTAMVNDQAS